MNRDESSIVESTDSKMSGDDIELREIPVHGQEIRIPSTKVTIPQRISVRLGPGSVSNLSDVGPLAVFA